MRREWPFDWVRWRRRAALPALLRARLDALPGRDAALRSVLREPLSSARFVALDLRTTGARMDHDRVLCLGAIAVQADSVRHQEGFERLLRQPQASPADDIVLRRSGEPPQLIAEDPVVALIEYLEFLQSAVIVAYRAPFDAAVLGREAVTLLGVRISNRFLDLSVLLPALYSGTQNNTLNDWLTHFELELPARHQALAVAHAHAALVQIVLRRALQAGLRTTGDLIRMQQAQRWLGLRQ
jgi:DNA polymerase III subunit epsilon